MTDCTEWHLRELPRQAADEGQMGMPRGGTA
jgi:hypothetical protein